MFRTACLAAVLLVSACAKQPTAGPTKAAPIHPDLHCPKGTLAAGRSPPDGYEVYCHQSTPAGRWIRTGPAIVWHGNEQLAAKGSYADDRKDGDWEFWYPTGELEKQGKFVHGVEEGQWKTFHPNGRPMSEGSFVDGKEHDKWIYWTEDGTGRTEGTWILGARDGTWLDYDASEKPVRERIFRNGRLINMREVTEPAASPPADGSNTVTRPG